MYRNYLQKAFYGANGYYMNHNSRLQPFTGCIIPEQLLGMYEYKKAINSIANTYHYYSHVEMYKNGDTMGRAIINHFYKHHREHASQFTIIDVGSGFGTMGKGILDFIQHKYPEEYEACKYYSVDISPYACQHAETMMRQHKNSEVINKSIFDFECPNTLTYFVCNELLSSFPHDLYCDGKWATEERNFINHNDELANTTLKLWNEVNPVNEQRADNSSIFLPTYMIQFMRKISTLRHELFIMDVNSVRTARKEANGPIIDDGYICFPTDFKFVEHCYHKIANRSSEFVSLKEFLYSYQETGITKSGFFPAADMNLNYTLMLSC